MRKVPVGRVEYSAVSYKWTRIQKKKEKRKSSKRRGGKYVGVKCAWWVVPLTSCTQHIQCVMLTGSSSECVAWSQCVVDTLAGWWVVLLVSATIDSYIQCVNTHCMYFGEWLSGFRSCCAKVIHCVDQLNKCLSWVWCVLADTSRPLTHSPLSTWNTYMLVSYIRLDLLDVYLWIDAINCAIDARVSSTTATLTCVVFATVTDRRDIKRTAVTRLDV